MNAVAKKKKAEPRANYERIYKSDPLAEVDQNTRDLIAPLENYIMKNCLWQFNSRGWDRRKQNAGILGKTAQILCGEEVDNPTPLEKCYWVDAVCLAEAYQHLAPWLKDLSAGQVKALIGLLHARMDWLTIDGSLNQELTVQQY